ncbi:hypothetical protein H4219_002571 [Mycoemilia scoparia]|uniref:Uncharacterized protein n=1 Tax=Mycoemilia scoparia TaxID=417184 RepID=A0A9W8A2Y4_9FUNG|nr:hypothetical protein H4219_002571 [Mycoemilia scoparia]
MRPSFINKSTFLAFVLVLVLIVSPSLLVFAFNQQLHDYVKDHYPQIRQTIIEKQALIKIIYREKYEKVKQIFPNLKEIPQDFNDDIYNKIIEAFGEDTIKSALKLGGFDYQGP